MKKILLGVTGVWAEMSRGKILKPFGTDAAAREIKFAHRAFDPDIHRKRAVKAVGEQQHTIGNFFTDTAQLHQFFARFRLRQLAQELQIKPATGNLPRCGEQMRRAKSHFARAEFGFGGGGKPFGCWKRIGQMIFVQTETAEP